MPEYNGLFITFEGGEGCGKSVLANDTYSYLKERGLDVVIGREPGGVEVSEAIRGILLDPQYKGKLNERTELALFFAARAGYVFEFVKPSLEKGKIVVSDRYDDSTRVYQGFGRGIPLHIIERINTFFTYNIRPNLTFVIDVPVKTALTRMKAIKRKKDRFEQEDIEFHKKIREGYLWVAKTFKRSILIDNSGLIERTRNEIRLHLDDFLEKYFK